MNRPTASHSPLAERILDAFPSGSYALLALLQLLDIVETTEVATAAVECRAQPRLLINPEFVEAKAGTPERLLMLVLHELHHVLLGHTRLFPRVTTVDNLVFDAVINALLCRMFPAPEHLAFFTDCYNDARFPECLLRPPPDWRPEGRWRPPAGLAALALTELRGVYRALYSAAGAGYRELYAALRRVVTEEQAGSVLLIGDHRREEQAGAASSAGHLDERSPVLFEVVRSIVERWPQPPNPIAGRSLSDLLQQADVGPARHHSNRTILRHLFRRLGDDLDTGSATVDRRSDSTEALTPLPVLDRRTMVLRVIGSSPLLHRWTVATVRRRRVGERVHVYLDVSGSIGDLKGALYGAVLDCRNAVHPVVHLFSTEIADVSLDELRRGSCRSTGGTDVRCVAQHIREHRIQRAVIITDGYVGRPAGEDAETLRRTRLGVALTPGEHTRADLSDVTDHWVELSCGKEGRS